MKISAVIVLYNKTISDSLTIKSIASYSGLFKKIIIHNNGPEEVFLDDHFDSSVFEVINDISNSPLSNIYNDFIANCEAERYVILDDDSQLTDDYVNNLLSHSDYYDLGLPMIHSSHDGNIYYPIINRINDIFNNKYVYPKGSYSIGSGLIISRRLADELIKYYGSVFDQSFVLYGVDITLFLRLNKIIENQDVICFSRGYLIHDLSKFDNNKSKFRVEELLIDQVLQYRLYHKSTKKFILYLIRNHKDIISLGMSCFPKVISALLHSRHPKSR